MVPGSFFHYGQVCLGESPSWAEPLRLYTILALNGYDRGENLPPPPILNGVGFNAFYGVILQVSS